MKFNIRHLLLILLLLCLLFTFRNNCLCIEPFAEQDIPQSYIDSEHNNYPEMSDRFRSRVPLSVYEARSNLQVFPKISLGLHPLRDTIYEEIEKWKVSTAPWHDDYGYYVSKTSVNLRENSLNRDTEGYPRVQLTCVDQRRNTIVYNIDNIELDIITDRFQCHPPTLQEAKDHGLYISLVDATNPNDFSIKYGNLIRLYPTSWENVSHYSEFNNPRNDLRYGLGRNTNPSGKKYIVYFWKVTHNDRMASGEEITPLNRFEFDNIREISNLNSENMEIGEMPDRPLRTQMIMYIEMPELCNY